MVQPLSDCNPECVAYEKVVPFKMELLQQAFSQAQSQGLGSDFFLFCEKNASWLDSHALFITLSNNFNNQPWNKWPAPLRDRDPQALKEFSNQFHQQIQKEKFYQYLIMQQWQNLHQHCKEIGVQLIGDLPMFVSYDSVDVWANREFFKLDQQLLPAFYAGAPPDRFNSQGQLWHNPVYNWEVLKKQEYSFWIERFRRSFELFDILRIDHFRGLIAYWETPANQQNASGGTWQSVPVDDF